LPSLVASGNQTPNLTFNTFGSPADATSCAKKSALFCNIPGYPSSGPRGCQITTAQCTPTHHLSLSIHTGWVVASGNQTPNLTFNTSGSPADATSCAQPLLVSQRC